jgi:hypothetical protein
METNYYIREAETKEAKPAAASKANLTSLGERSSDTV